MHFHSRCHDHLKPVSARLLPLACVSLFNRSVGRFVGLFGRLVCWLVDWLIVYYLVGWSIGFERTACCHGNPEGGLVIAIKGMSARVPSIPADALVGGARCRCTGSGLSAGRRDQHGQNLSLDLACPPPTTDRPHRTHVLVLNTYRCNWLA